MGRVAGSAARVLATDGRTASQAVLHGRPDAAASAGVLGAAHGVTLPSLAGVTPEFQVMNGNRIATQFALVIVELGLADGVVFDGDVDAFIAAVFSEWIDDRGGHWIRTWLFNFFAMLNDGPGRWTGYGDAHEEKGKLWIACGAGGDSIRVIKWSDTIRVLAAAHRRYPATFYKLFAGSLSAIVPMYDWHDAQAYEEMIWEWNEKEGETTVDLRPREMTSESALSPNDLKASLRSLRAHPEAKELMRAALKLHDIARGFRYPAPVSYGDEWTRPLPAMLCCQEENDEICGHFDAEMNEIFQTGEACAPCLVIELPVRKKPQMKRAVEAFWRAVEVIKAACDVISLMPNATEPVPLADMLSVYEDQESPQQLQMVLVAVDDEDEEDLDW